MDDFVVTSRAWLFTYTKPYLMVELIHVDKVSISTQIQPFAYLRHWWSEEISGSTDSVVHKGAGNIKFYGELLYGRHAAEDKIDWSAPRPNQPCVRCQGRKEAHAGCDKARNTESTYDLVSVFTEILIFTTKDCFKDNQKTRACCEVAMIAVRSDMQTSFLSTYVALQ